MPGFDVIRQDMIPAIQSGQGLSGLVERQRGTWAAAQQQVWVIAGGLYQTDQVIHNGLIHMDVPNQGLDPIHFFRCRNGLEGVNGMLTG